jgi:glutathione S-transferase
MKLHDFAFSPNSRKVRAVAYELDVALEHEPVDLLKGDQHSPTFLQLNPNGRVPVLVDGDFVLWESTAIMRYLVAKKGGPLLPATPRASAEVDRWLAWQLAHLAPAMRTVAFERVVKKLTGQGAPDEAAIAAATVQFNALSAILDGALEGREYVTGVLSLADFALASHYSLADASGLDLAPFARVRAWLDRMLARDSMRKTLADAHEAVKRRAA